MGETKEFRGEFAYIPDGAQRAAYLIGADGEQVRSVAAVLKKAEREVCALVAIPVSDWDRELTPWPSDCIPGRDFAGRGRERLEDVCGAVADAQSAFGFSREKRDRAIIGYSLGGLAALFAYCETGIFGMGGSVSGALWYPGWTEYATARNSISGRIYLSLGKQEIRRGPALLRQGGEAARITQEAFLRGGADCTFEWNNGNHFFEPDRRIARAVLHLMDGDGGPIST